MNKILVNNKEYSVIKLLGKVKSGYSYLVTDGKGRYVLKQIHHEPCSYYNFGNKLEAELSAFAKLKEIGLKIPDLLETDVGNERILKEYIEGYTVFDLVLQDKMKAEYFDAIRAICRLLYSANINIDYFPTNFIPREGELYYIDYEYNMYSDEWNFENWGSKYWSKTDEFNRYLNDKGLNKIS